MPWLASPFIGFFAVGIPNIDKGRISAFITPESGDNNEVV
jgi:hypothetical protein